MWTYTHPSSTMLLGCTCQLFIVGWFWWGAAWILVYPEACSSKSWRCPLCVDKTEFCSILIIGKLAVREFELTRQKKCCLLLWDKIYLSRAFLVCKQLKCVCTLPLFSSLKGPGRLCYCWRSLMRLWDPSCVRHIQQTVGVFFLPILFLGPVCSEHGGLYCVLAIVILRHRLHVNTKMICSKHREVDSNIITIQICTDNEAIDVEVGIGVWINNMKHTVHK